MQRQAQIVREGGSSPSQAVRYVVVLDGHLHSKHRHPRKALAVLSDLGVAQIKKVERGTLMYEATIRPRATTAGIDRRFLAVSEPQPEVRAYTHKHVVAQPKVGNVTYGQEHPHPTYEHVMNHTAPLWSMPNPGCTFEHRAYHQGKVVGKLRYTVRPKQDVNTVKVEGLAVHPDHRGNGLASYLMDRLQKNAAETDRKIDHGDRTPNGHAWWQRYSQGPSFLPSVHHPSGDAPHPDLVSHHTYDALFDEHEDEQGRTASRRLGYQPMQQHMDGWVHLYQNVHDGWEK